MMVMLLLLRQKVSIESNAVHLPPKTESSVECYKTILEEFLISQQQHNQAQSNKQYQGMLWLNKEHCFRYRNKLFSILNLAGKSRFSPKKKFHNIDRKPIWKTFICTILKQTTSTTKKSPFDSIHKFYFCALLKRIPFVQVVGRALVTVSVPRCLEYFSIFGHLQQ